MKPMAASTVLLVRPAGISCQMSLTLGAGLHGVQTSAFLAHSTVVQVTGWPRTVISVILPFWAS